MEGEDGVDVFGVGGVWGCVEVWGLIHCWGLGRVDRGIDFWVVLG